jgi:aryl-alcohol dehydrogenase-like predicted oxidoreductase
MTRLALGTVQFGLAYGIANSGGKASAGEVARILTRARAAGMEVLDTAAGYGDSEAVLGAEGVADWKVVTKIGQIPDDCDDIDVWVNLRVDQSLKRLGINRLHGLLLHRPQQLLTEKGKALWHALRRQQDSGLVEHIGYSIYEPAELDALSPFRPGIVQAPFNVLDRRLAQSGWLSRLAQGGVAVHTRSTFLQGLLLMEANARPAWTRAYTAVFDAFDAWALESAGDQHSACLSYCLAQREISQVIIGVQDARQLEAALAAAQLSIGPPPIWADMDAPELVDPRLWP